MVTSKARAMDTCPRIKKNRDGYDSYQYSLEFEPIKQNRDGSLQHPNATYSQNFRSCRRGCIYNANLQKCVKGRSICKN